MLTEEKSVVKAPNIKGFFNIIDNFSEARGKDVPQIVKIEELRSFPEGTFGKAWADFLDKNDLQPLSTGFRRKQLHDGVHVLTDYGSDSIGEAELQAFLLGAKFGLLNLFIGIGLLRVIRKRLPNQTSSVRERVWKAYKRGQSSNFNPDTWEPELLWDLSLNEVRAMFCIDKS
ncbi:MAG: Coq4 family protein [Cyanobacteriota bacterium]|nr:Coq4 family protein [Cyanobacteriota bacterium]